MSWTAHYFDRRLNSEGVSRACASKEDALRLACDLICRRYTRNPDRERYIVAPVASRRLRSVDGQSNGRSGVRSHPATQARGENAARSEIHTTAETRSSGLRTNPSTQCRRRGCAERSSSPATVNSRHNQTDPLPVFGSDSGNSLRLRIVPVSSVPKRLSQFPRPFSKARVRGSMQNARAAFQPCEGEVPPRTMYLETVDWATSKPSIRSSPWIRDAPHCWFSLLIR